MYLIVSNVLLTSAQAIWIFLSEGIGFFEYMYTFKSTFQIVLNKLHKSFFYFNKNELRKLMIVNHL